MRTRLLIAVSLMPLIALADDPLPKRPDFNRYQAMLTRSPFAIATVAVPSATPDFAKDLFVANAARSADGGFVTIASATDRNLKEYLSTKGENEHGFAISDIQWSDQVGQTKVTITKDGKYATLTFNQALLSQALQNPNQPQMNALATAALPVWNAAAAATLHEAGADSVSPAYLPAGQADSAGPNPSARRDPAKSSDASADAYRSAAGRLRRIATVPSRRPRYQGSDPDRPSTGHIWWDSFVRESGKRKDYPRDRSELPP